MSLRLRLYKAWSRRHRLKLQPAQVIALVFAGLILLGALLLNLPIASRDGQSCGFLPSGIALIPIGAKNPPPENLWSL